LVGKENAANEPIDVGTSLQSCVMNLNFLIEPSVGPPLQDIVIAILIAA
jgi:hypothetical protein